VTAGRFALALAIAAAGCAGPSPSPTTGLEGRIWDVRGQRFASEEELAAQLRKSRFRLLGEVHDHPGHHRLRADLIGRIGGPAEVYFEQFDRENDAALRSAQAKGADPDALIGAGKMARDWNGPLYKPLLESALAAGHPVRAANLSTADTRRIARAGALGTGDKALAAALERSDWTALREQEMRREIFESHCGALPERLAPAMVLAQRARDATLALALAEASGSAVLIAGNGHVRRDVGVPLYLPAGSPVLSVGFVETRDDEPDPRGYARGVAGEVAYDYVWFTSPQARPDPCQALIKR
jgi:uncharacterized iron-regulated protein